jgi:dATP pyrophosphohydrolase
MFRRSGRRVQFLLLRRARHKSLPGVWQPVTGKLRRGESARRAAAREVAEETGLRPQRWWVLETVTLFFDPAANVLLLLPLFAAETGARQPVRLSAEHDAFEFVSARVAARRVLWDSQRAGLRAVARQILRGGPLARALALDVVSSSRERRGGARSARTASSTRARRPRGRVTTQR